MLLYGQAKQHKQNKQFSKVSLTNIKFKKVLKSLKKDLTNQIKCDILQLNKTSFIPKQNKQYLYNIISKYMLIHFIRFVTTNYKQLVRYKQDNNK